MPRQFLISALLSLKRRNFLPDAVKVQQGPQLLHGPRLGRTSSLLKALEMAKSKDPEKIRDALESIKNFPGTVGTYNMSRTDHTGLSYKDIRIIQIKDGKPMAIKH